MIAYSDTNNNMSNIMKLVFRALYVYLYAICILYYVPLHQSAITLCVLYIYLLNNFSIN